MSHIVTIRTQVRDPTALAAACRRLELPAPAVGTATLYSSRATGLIVNLPAWRYPVVADSDTGELHYDNFNGAWGAPGELDKLLQACAVEKARIEARRAGYTLAEQALSDGSIKLTIQAGTGSGGGV